MSYNIFLILIIIVAVLLVLIIMVQNPKGGGLSSSFGGTGTQSLGGVQSTTNFLDKSTWTLSIVLLSLILLSNISAPRGNNIPEDTLIQETLDNRDVEDFTIEETEEVPVTTPDTIQ